MGSQAGGDNLPGERLATPPQTTVRSSPERVRTVQNRRPPEATTPGGELWSSPSSLNDLEKKKIIREATINWKNLVQDLKSGRCTSFSMRLRKKRAGLKTFFRACKVHLLFNVYVSEILGKHAKEKNNPKQLSREPVSTLQLLHTEQHCPWVLTKLTPKGQGGTSTQRRDPAGLGPVLLTNQAAY